MQVNSNHTQTTFPRLRTLRPKSPRKTLLYYSILSLIASQAIGCATTESRVLGGAAIGATTGTIIAHQHKGTKKARIVGGATGSLLGGLIGYFYDKEKKSSHAVKNQELKKTKSLKKLAPSLTQSKVTMYWEPDKIEGNKFIEKHRVWVLESGPQWTR